MYLLKLTFHKTTLSIFAVFVILCVDKKHFFHLIFIVCHLVQLVNTTNEKNSLSCWMLSLCSLSVILFIILFFFRLDLLKKQVRINSQIGPVETTSHLLSHRQNRFSRRLNHVSHLYSFSFHHWCLLNHG